MALKPSVSGNYSANNADNLLRDIQKDFNDHPDSRGPSPTRTDIEDHLMTFYHDDYLRLFPVDQEDRPVSP